MDELTQNEMATLLAVYREQTLHLLDEMTADLLALEAGNHAAAVEVIQSGIANIHEFYRQQSRPDSAEQSGELHLLESWLCEVQARRPLSEREKLEKALHEAVGREDYEKAAQVRDALRNLKGSR